MAAYRRVDDLLWRMTCGLTGCTPGSAPAPTLDNEYGKPLTFTFNLAYGRGAKYCEKNKQTNKTDAQIANCDLYVYLSVCLSACLLVYLKNHISKCQMSNFRYMLPVL